ncbi:hypothetical protein BT69DRAFT_1332309 [Atractiella rhizophila]|nr:hypothetical protein BT69DRAFT_1332309 [Atractiella rhizophila]
MSRTNSGIVDVSKIREGVEGLSLSEPVTPTKAQISKEKVLDILRGEGQNGKKILSLIVVGHVDAGKSTLLGRILAESGELSEREKEQNARQSEKMGKGSFHLAWALDADKEERERGVTINIALSSFSTPSRTFTLIDAPGHADFVPNMISGASQADVSVLVVDASTGSFEKGFEGGGQTREHAQLVRSLGVKECIVAVNKMDTVGWSQERFEEIKDKLEPFLIGCGYQKDKLDFIPVDAFTGENVMSRSKDTAPWYQGSTLVDNLDKMTVPPRPYDAPLRLPASNVFKGGQGSASSGIGVSGRVESGILIVGSKVKVMPADELAVVRSIETDGGLVQWAAAGTNVSAFLSGIDQVYLSSGSVLCEETNVIPLASTFEAQIVVFDLKYPLTIGAQVELFHHSRDIPATITKLEAILDRQTGAVVKKNPRLVAALIYKQMAQLKTRR